MKNEKPIIRIKGVKKFYPLGKVRALDGIDLDIMPGEFVAVMGPSGCGKSTLIHMIGGVDTPTDGSIAVCGKALEFLSNDELAVFRRENVGIIFQSFNLLPTLNVLENVLVPVMPFAGLDDGYRKRASYLLERFGLGEKVNNSPGELSGGQNQRVAIARALINSPKIILADEPTGQLDTRTGEEIMHLLKELNEKDGVTIILVTHDQKTASYAKRLINLRDGRVVGARG